MSKRVQVLIWVWVMALGAIAPSVQHVCCATTPSPMAIPQEPACSKCPERKAAPKACKECESNCRCAFAKPLVEQATVTAISLEVPDAPVIRDLVSPMIVCRIVPPVQIIRCGPDPPCARQVRAIRLRAPPAA